MRLVIASATLVAACLVGTTVVHADQCQLVDAETASWAMKAVTKGSVVIAFCEPCGDKKPGAPATVNKIDVKGDKTSRQISINGKDVDLAYTFVQTGKNTYSNVAMMAGCPVQQVSSFIAGPKATSSQIAMKNGIPATCAAYVESVTRLMRCDKMPKDSRDAMKQALDAMRDGWKNLPADAAQAASDACQQAGDAMVQAASSMGC